MDRDLVTGVSRFGRLRKMSTKLMDLPNSTSHEIMVEPYVDSKPELNRQVTLMDDETDSSSSIGENSEICVPFNGKSTKNCINKKLLEKKKV